MVLTVTTAILGFNRHMNARRLSRHTIRDYNTTLDRFQAFIGAERRLDLITTEDVEEFLAYWRDNLTRPAGVADRGAIRLSAKSLENMRIALSSLWSWAEQAGHVHEHVIRGRIRPVKFNPPPIEPFTPEEIRAMLSVCEKTAPTESKTGRMVARKRPTAKRDRALLFFLLDTGCRVSEVTGLSLADLDINNNEVTVSGKGDKIRIIPFSDQTGNALFDYLASRGVIRVRGNNGHRFNHVDTEDRTIPVFAAARKRGGFLDRSSLLSLVRRIGDRAGVSNAHPHRFRHTCGIMYLRNGGDIYTLQAIFGHSSLDMVKRYLAIASVDIKRAHQRASPVANL